MQKCKELESPNSCLSKAADLEPLFVLRAQDGLAPSIVRLWAARFMQEHMDQGTFTSVMSVKYTKAMQLANDMEAWPTRKTPD